MEAWEELDVDDSDLPSLLRPCNNSKKRHQILHSPPKSPNQPISSQSLSSQTLIPSPFHHIRPPTTSAPPPPQQLLIPGPAGAIQAAMLRKRSNECSEEEPIMPTQEYIRRAVENAEEFYQEDDDFKGNPWLRAIKLLNTGQSSEDFVLRSTPLSSVNNSHVKVDQVVAVIKSCTPNGLGDMMVTLKDPTGTINGSIHRKVLSESEFTKEISVSSVLILEKVSVFAPSRSQTTLYLNITKSNVVKVFGKDIVPPLRQTHPAPKVVYALPSDCSGKMSMLHKTFSQELGRTEGIINKVGDVSQVANARGSWNFNSRKEKRNPFSRSDDCNNQNAGIWKEALQAIHSAPAKEIFEEAVEMNIAEHNQMTFDSNEKRPMSNNLSDRLHRSSAAANLVVDCSDEVRGIDKLQKQRQPAIPKTSLPQWTDEQLNELFAGDFDNDGPLF